MVIVLMGVSGAGKTTIGTRLAEKLDWEFFDGDEFHPAANIDKMAEGIPLDDEDRWPWLRALHDFIHERLIVGAPAVVACSALKGDYREILMDGNQGARLVYLKGSRALIRRRLEQRADHFFDAELLETQFDALEEPCPDEALTVPIDQPPEAIVRTIKSALVSNPA
jgi:carbohydrate kinase (thermoresistant glucokinase family)